MCAWFEGSLDVLEGFYTWFAAAADFTEQSVAAICDSLEQFMLYTMLLYERGGSALSDMLFFIFAFFVGIIHCGFKPRNE